jgi:hypothetical protein
VSRPATTLDLLRRLQASERDVQRARERTDAAEQRAARAERSAREAWEFARAVIRTTKVRCRSCHADILEVFKRPRCGREAPNAKAMRLDSHCPDARRNGNRDSVGSDCSSARISTAT